MRKSKKIIALLLAIVTIFSAVSISVSATGADVLLKRELSHKEFEVEFEVYLSMVSVVRSISISNSFPLPPEVTTFPDYTETPTGESHWFY